MVQKRKRVKKYYRRASGLAGFFGKVIQVRPHIRKSSSKKGRRKK